MRGVSDPRDPLSEDLAGDAVGALMPVGGTIGKRMARAVIAEWKRNRSAALRAAERASGLSREDFAEWAEREPRAVPLYMKILWASAMNGHDQTLTAMGAVLGEAARASGRGDDEGFEDAELALRAMSELGPRHFRVLAVLEDSVRIQTESGGDNLGEFMPQHVAVKADVREDVAHQCLLNLANAGLVTTTPVYEGSAYPLTELGRAVLRAARAASD